MAYQNAKKIRNLLKKISIGTLLPIIAILGVIPLITYMYKYYTKLENFEWFKGSSQTLDFSFIQSLSGSSLHVSILFLSYLCNLCR